MGPCTGEACDWALRTIGDDGGKGEECDGR